MVQFRVTVKSNYDLSRVAEALKKPTKLMKQIGVIRERSFKQMVELNQHPNGRKLRVLSPAYVIYKRKKYGSKPKRVATGNTVSKYHQRVYGNRLIETIDSPVAGYLAGMDLPLLPESFEGMKKPDRLAIKEAVLDFVNDII